MRTAPLTEGEKTPASATQIPSCAQTAQSYTAEARSDISKIDHLLQNPEEAKKELHKLKVNHPELKDLASFLDFLRVFKAYAENYINER
ncbi:MAG: hypothetical protein SFT81_03700 [Candidatus Caenarcaniphilales bacterium]|nr:hypothetical protein [Candidatus Caenarcaniphilales bacterium]